ncbi:MAG: glycoside hydrolase family 5 protein, partial [Fervidobacterium sp.]
DFLAQHGVRGILDLHNYNDMCGDFGSQKLVQNWRRMAEHYRGDPRVVAYELFNEPGSSTWDPSIKSKLDVAHFYANLTDAIREVDPYHIVIWESQPYVPPLEEIADLLRPNLVFTFHRWWTNDKWEFDVWTPEQLSYMSLAYAVEYREKLNVPFWFGEFGSGYPFNSSNPEWLLAEQHLWRCEEQVVGWNLWMGRTDINKSWNYYMPFFPLKVYNHDLIREPWEPPSPSFVGYVLDWKGVDRLEPYRIELWHNGDYVILKPGIIVRVIVNRKLPDGTLEIVFDQELVLKENTKIVNVEGTADYLGDWNTKIYPVRYADSNSVGAP